MRARDTLIRNAALFLRLAYRNLSRQGLRTILTLSAIVLGVAGLILARGFVEDIFVQLGEGTIHSQLGHVQIYRTGYLENGVQRPLAFIIDDPSRVLQATRALPEVRETMSRLNFSGLLNDGRHDAAALIEGIQPSREALVATFHQVIDGRRLRDSDGYGIYVGEGVATKLHLRPGQAVNLVVSTPGGALNTLEFEVIGVFRSYSKDYDARAAQINLVAAQELLQTTGINSMVVLLRNTADTDPVANRLRAALPSPGFEVRTWSELSDFYTKTVDLFKRQFGFLELVILLLIVLSVLNTINLNLFERRGEFGTMRALGNSNRHIFTLIVCEALFLGIAGSVAGMLLGVLLAMAISAIGIPMPPPPNADLGYVAQIRMTPFGVAGAGLVGVVASLLASLLPGRRISRMPIVDALRQNV